MNDNIYKLIVPIEMGQDNIVEEVKLHKPTLGELTKVRARDDYTKGLEMLVACSDQPKIVLQRLSYDDTQKLMGEVLPDFLDFQEQETD